MNEFPIKLYKQADQHYNPEGEENQQTKLMLSHIMVDKISTGMVHMGLNADCWVQQNSLQLQNAPIPDLGYLKTDCPSHSKIEQFPWSTSMFLIKN